MHCSTGIGLDSSVTGGGGPDGEDTEVSQPPYRPEDTQPGYWNSPSQQPAPPSAYQVPSYTQQYAAQPGWQEQQPYGYPGYDPYGQHPYGQPPRGNGMAVAGFVLSFFIGLLGLIFSIIGLRRSSEPGRSGRGLAIAGIVISLLNIGFSVLIGIGIAAGVANDPSLSGTTDAASASSTAPAPAAGSETIVQACQVVIPAVTGAQADLQTATSISDMLGKINKLADTVEQQGVASGDATFTADTANLATQYRTLMHAAQSGGKPDYTALAKAGEAVGYDCGKVGVVPK